MSWNTKSIECLGDVRNAVSDWPKMRGRMYEAITALQNGPSSADIELRDETEALLKWLVDDRFTFLGYREYKLRHTEGKDLSTIRSMAVGWAFCGLTIVAYAPSNSPRRCGATPVQRKV